jgi:two-component system invasion response regulator UvrY
MKPEGIILADPHPQVRSALRLLLEQANGLRIAGEAGTAEEAITRVRTSCPALIILDWGLPGVSPGNLIGMLRDWCPDLLVIALSSRPESRQPALAAGVDGFVSKGDPPERVLSVVRSVLKGSDP